MPAEIDAVLRRVCAALADARVESAILTGSAARGEMSYFTTGNALVVRSDLELYVVAREPARVRAAVRGPIAAVERDAAARWPGFHVDLAILTPRQLRRLPPHIRHFELKRNGTTVLGADLLGDVPDVGLDDLDWRELNDTVLWRTATLLACLPPGWLAHRAPIGAAQSHVLARVVLDLTLWALPGLGLLAPTFGERTAAWGEPRIARELRGTPLPSVRLLEACLRARRAMTPEIGADELLATAASAWSWALDVATGRARWSHAGAAAGLSRPDAVRRARFALRAARHRRRLAFGHARVCATVARDGYARIAAEHARALVDEACRMRVEAPEAGAVASWTARRTSLLRWLDAVLARREWERRAVESE
jgi:hypothetical protein